MAENRSENYRDRIHSILLYPDNEKHNRAYEIITKSYDYASILHDKDIHENGEKKKPHIHVVVRFGQARWASAVCKELGIEENYIEKTRNFVNALMYLIHYNDPDKAQYDICEVNGPLKNRLQQEIAKVDKTESEKVIELFDFIDSIAEPISCMEFCRYCSSMGYWSEFRRSGIIFMRLLEEHNMKYGGNVEK